MKKLSSSILVIYSVLIICLIGFSVVAQADQLDFEEVDSEQVENKIFGVVNFALTKIAPAIGVILIIIAGLKFASGDAEGSERLWKGIIGVGIALASAGIIGLLQNSLDFGWNSNSSIQIYKLLM